LDLTDPKAAALLFSRGLLAVFLAAVEEEVLWFFGGIIPWLQLAAAAAGWLLMGWLLLLTCIMQRIRGHISCTLLEQEADAHSRGAEIQVSNSISISGRPRNQSAENHAMRAKKNMSMAMSQMENQQCKAPD
jgi:hypothetical protein